MVPLRLLLFLIGILFLILFLISNPQEVSFNFLVWQSTYRMYEILIFGIIYGSILYILLSTHIKDVINRNRR